MKKWLKKTGYGLLGLLVLLIVIVLLIPGERKVETSMAIHAPVQMIFDQVNDLRNWEKWLPWQTMDPAMEFSFSNPAIGKGAFLRWSSTDPRVGNGRVTLLEVVPHTRIVAVINEENGKDNISEFEFEQDKRHVQVTWRMTVNTGNNPIRKVRALIQKGALRKSFSQGLLGIRARTEKR